MSSVFLSGTFDDLQRERSSLLDVFHRIGMSVRAQEYFGAVAAPPPSKFKRQMCDGECGLYVLVLGYRYGSLVPLDQIPPELDQRADRPISYSKMEFDLATIQRMDRLVYIKAAGSRPKHDIDTEKASARDEFVRKIEKSGCTYGRFKTAQALSVQVAIDTMRYLHDQDWIQKFAAAVDMENIEQFADDLGTLGGHRAVDALLYRLGDDPVQQDDDLHDAVCGALAKLKVMRRKGPNHYTFRRLKSLPSNVRQLIERYRQLIPSKYFPKR